MTVTICALIHHTKFNVPASGTDPASAILLMELIRLTIVSALSASYPFPRQVPKSIRVTSAFRPQLPRQIKQLMLKTARFGKHPQGFRYFGRFRPALRGFNARPSSSPSPGGAQRPCKSAGSISAGRRYKTPAPRHQRPADHRPVSPLQLRFFPHIPAGDHHAGGDFHFPRMSRCPSSSS